YEYSIDGTTWQLSGNFTNLTPGSYEVFIRDANAVGCFISLTTIEILPGGYVTGTVESFSITCFGGNNGSITISDPQNGSGIYEYSIDSGYSWQATGIYTGLVAGTYKVMLRDAITPTNAVLLENVELTEPESFTAIITASSISCYGLTDGKIHFAEPTGGSGNFDYSIDNGFTWQSESDFTDLVAGVYVLWMRDTDNSICKSYLGEVVITEPQLLTAIALTTPSSCNGINGKIIVVSSGGTGGYEYMLTGYSGWQYSNEFNGLAPGTYTAEVRDANACETDISDIVIESIAGPDIVDVNTTPATNGQNNGEAEVIANGEATPLEYSLDGINWQLSITFTGLPVGTDTAWVRDANGCIAFQEFIIMQTIEGIVEVSVDTLSYCLNLPIIMPIEARDFTGIASFIIELDFDPAILTFVELLNENASLNNGTFSVSVVNGTLQIRFSAYSGSITLPNGEQLFSLHFEGLAAGLSNLNWNLLHCNIYSSSGDTIPSIFTPGLAEVLPIPVIYTDGNGVYCEGDTLTLHAGTLDGQNLNFEWTGPTGTKHNNPEWQLSPLGVNDNGAYSLIATNPELCNTSQLVTININPKPNIQIGYTDTICFGQQLILDPGSGYVSYLWQDGSTMQSQMAYEEGIYWVQVTDTNSCKASDSVSLVKCNIEILIPNAFTPNSDGLNDIFKPIFSGFEPGMYSLTIYSKWGQIMFTSTEVSTGWDGTIDGVLAPPGVYVYVISYAAPAYVTRALPSPVTGDVTLVR
ncbi:MAG: hypothetical protein CVU14_11250, partial [Bacteroidetes bacterium HGW-Bacteroidetes-9]